MEEQQEIHVENRYNIFHQLSLNPWMHKSWIQRDTYAWILLFKCIFHFINMIYTYIRLVIGICTYIHIYVYICICLIYHVYINLKSNWSLCFTLEKCRCRNLVITCSACGLKHFCEYNAMSTTLGIAKLKRREALKERKKARCGIRRRWNHKEKWVFLVVWVRC